MSQITITCIPCNNEAKYHGVIYNQTPMNVTFKSDDKTLFGEINAHICPFCGVKLIQTDIMRAFFDFMDKHKLSFEIKGEIIEIANSEYNLVVNKNDIIGRNSLIDIPFHISPNECELIRLMIMDIDLDQWKLQMEYENSYVE